MTRIFYIRVYSFLYNYHIVSHSQRTYTYIYSYQLFPYMWLLVSFLLVGWNVAYKSSRPARLCWFNEATNIPWQYTMHKIYHLNVIYKLHCCTCTIAVVIIIFNVSQILIRKVFYSNFVFLFNKLRIANNGRVDIGFNIV